MLTFSDDEDDSDFVVIAVTGGGAGTERTDDTTTHTATTDKGTATAHGMANGDPFFVTTTGTLPALASGTFTPRKVYYAGAITANTFSLHPTKADGIAGSNGLDMTDTGSGTHTFQALVVIAGLRSNSFNLNGETSDVTTKDSTGLWRELLAAAGVVSMSISGSGIFQDDSNVIALRAAVISRAADTYSIVFESGDEYYGLFQVTSIEQAG